MKQFLLFDPLDEFGVIRKLVVVVTHEGSGTRGSFKVLAPIMRVLIYLRVPLITIHDSPANAGFTTFR
jgi:hypothetical protein